MLYGDSYLRLDLSAVHVSFRESDQPALMTVLRNDNRWGPSNADFDGQLVTGYSKIGGNFEWIDYGLSLLARDVIAEIPPRNPSTWQTFSPGSAVRGGWPASRSRNGSTRSDPPKDSTSSKGCSTLSTSDNRHNDGKALRYATRTPWTSRRSTSSSSLISVVTTYGTV